jgi:hypothetical protein
MDKTELAYGQGYVAAMRKIAEDLHTQAHLEMDAKGNGDARGVAFYQTYELLLQEAKIIEDDIQRQWRAEHPE